MIGTPVEAYLKSRRIPLDADILESGALSFHPSLKHPADGKMPCMVGLFRDVLTGEPCGVHRTFIKDGRKHGVPLMLGRSGGAAIMLTPDVDVTIGLGICEGVETGLSVMRLNWRPVWAVGSAGGIENFPLLPGIESLTVWADNDANGRGEEAAMKCCKRWRGAGREAVCRMPETVGQDWNDVWQNHVRQQTMSAAA